MRAAQQAEKEGRELALEGKVRDVEDVFREIYEQEHALTASAVPSAVPPSEPTFGSPFLSVQHRAMSTALSSQKTAINRYTSKLLISVTCCKNLVGNRLGGDCWTRRGCHCCDLQYAVPC
jgi:hypothetical protein